MASRSGVLMMAVALAGIGAGVARADIDNLNVVVAPGVATGLTASGSTIALGAFTYDSTNDAFYTTGYSTSGQLLRITKAADGSYTQVEVAASPAQLLGWQQSQAAAAYPNSAISSTSPTLSGLVINPNGGSAVGVNIVNAVSVDGTKVPALTPKFYSYNLQTSTVADGTDVFAPVASQGQLNTASGSSSSNTVANIGRNFAWASDNVSIYFNSSVNNTSSAPAIAGLWKLNTSTGSLSKILNGAGYYAEVSVSRQSATVDRIYTNSIAANNGGGVDYVDYDSSTSTASAVKSLVSADTIRNFLELPSTVTLGDTVSTATDAQGNVYFTANGGATGSRAVLALDAQGRLVKVLSNTERAAVFGSSINATAQRFQTITGTYTNPTTGQSFQTTNILYAEASGVSAIGSITVFKGGDFTRDNVLNIDDLTALHNALLTSGAASTSLVFDKYDLNGNGKFSYKDVTIAQQFLEFGNGDVNLDGVVDFKDFQALQNNYGSSLDVNWANGDLNGDGVVDFKDFQLLQNSYGYVDPLLAGTTITADLRALPLSLAAVPEPATAAVLGIGGLLMLRRRKREA